MSNKFTPEEKQKVKNFVLGFMIKFRDVKLSEDYESLKKSMDSISDFIENDDIGKDFQSLCEKIDKLNI